MSHSRRENGNRERSQSARMIRMGGFSLGPGLRPYVGARLGWVESSI